MRHHLTALLLSVMLLFATVFGVASSTSEAEASTGAFVHRHFVGTQCLWPEGSYWYLYHWHYPNGQFFWLEVVRQPGVYCT